MKFKHFVILVILICLTSFLLTRQQSGHLQTLANAQSSSLHTALDAQIHVSFQRVADDGSYSVVSLPQLPATRINAILAAYGSPFMGDGQLIYDLGHTYQISSDYALAFWLHESSFGTAGEAVVTRNPGNMRCIRGFACIDNFAQFTSWQEGIEQWYLLIRNGYVLGRVTIPIVGHPCTTVDAIANVYDQTTAQAYAAAIKAEVDGWRAGKVVL